jgi:glycosyltransferase involved in cell wall biosynthesis
MRIVLVVPAFPKLSETFIISKFRGLLQRGWDVHMVCSESDQDEWEWFKEFQNLRDRVHVTWPARPRWLAALLTPLALVRCLVHNPADTVRYVFKGWQKFGIGVFRQLYFDAEFLVLQPELIHFEFGSIAVNRMTVKDLLKYKVVVSFRGYDLNYVGIDIASYYKDVWAGSDAVHCLGEDLWLKAQKRGCPRDKPHFLIPPAINTDFFNPGDRAHTEVSGTATRPLRILSVGRLDWRKGYEYAFKALQLLIGQQFYCTLRIIGEGEFLTAAAFARHQLGLENSVSLLGACGPEEVKSHMQEVDVLLHAAVSEGFCNAVLEAQAMALPVLCTDAGGLPENVHDGETGFVVRRRDPEALAEKLVLLAKDPQMRQQMGSSGRIRVLQHFALKDQISSFELLYRQILNSGYLKPEPSFEDPIEVRVKKEHVH